MEDSPEVVAKYGDTFTAQARKTGSRSTATMEFQDVSFKYPDGEEYILEHFNLKVPRSTNVAIVGARRARASPRSVNLVCRFFEPTKRPHPHRRARTTRERSQLWLHSNIGYVLQNPHLFSGTVLENIRYGKPDATDEGGRGRSCKAVSADTRSSTSSKTAATATSARAATSSPPAENSWSPLRERCLPTRAIFVLDEATSSIDTQHRAA
ncbi:MAG: hypothetical protein ACLU9S_12895 [Oscillospiraceae bacterium]